MSRVRDPATSTISVKSNRMSTPDVNVRETGETKTIAGQKK
ncbi:MAG TPA: hypothetical protein VMM93_10960 [Vicinamibacterales bacterium]|nr:hypothetical protein [Vicinamibacterales bacterium]